MDGALPRNEIIVGHTGFFGNHGMAQIVPLKEDGFLERKLGEAEVRIEPSKICQTVKGLQFGDDVEPFGKAFAEPGPPTIQLVGVMQVPLKQGVEQ